MNNVLFELMRGKSDMDNCSQLILSNASVSNINVSDATLLTIQITYENAFVKINAGAFAGMKMIGMSHAHHGHCRATVTIHSLIPHCDIVSMVRICRCKHQNAIFLFTLSCKRIRNIHCSLHALENLTF